ncbi:hypothetical protein B0T14DRAFT_603871 [Immersiella caudata]|uniref:Uncharacterized protein n=1 Tax=Immersiella caudata TaxID=314043 RepID=A0AA40BZY3_9PEZI|nr:hypothetical protein B0T14DRAFT_603871 [Immersiella caudata]
MGNAWPKPPPQHRPYNRAVSARQHMTIEVTNAATENTTRNGRPGTVPFAGRYLRSGPNSELIRENNNWISGSRSGTVRAIEAPSGMRMEFHPDLAEDEDENADANNAGEPPALVDHAPTRNSHSRPATKVAVPAQRAPLGGWAANFDAYSGHGSSLEARGLDGESLYAGPRGYRGYS